MSFDTTHDPLEIDRENARFAAISLAIWLVLTAAAVMLLIIAGPTLTGLFV
jgi:hypothetical protein